MTTPPHFPIRGVCFGCLGAFLFTLQDATFKYFDESFAVAQIIFLRSISTLLVAFCWVRLSIENNPLRIGNPKLFAVSLIANISAWFCFYTGLSALSLTVAICIFFLTPVVIAILAVPVLKEKLTWRQLLALLCGLSGVLVITDPFAGNREIDLIAIGWVLASVVLWATVAVTTRALQPSMTISGTLLYSTLAFLLVSGFMQPLVWQPPSATELTAMLLLGVVSAGAQSCVWAAYRAAQAGVVAIAEYSALIWAALFGWLLWDERQTLRDFFGVALIITAGAVVLIQRSQKTPHHP